MTAANDNDKAKLFDAKAFDEEKTWHVRWTVNDVLAPWPRAFLAYHVTKAGWDFVTPVGVVLGGTLHAMGLWRGGGGGYNGSVWHAMGRGGLVAGTIGATLGLAGLFHTARQGEQATPRPWNKAGRDERVQGLQHNFGVRVMDVSTCMAMTATAVLLGMISRPGMMRPRRPLGGAGVGAMMALGSSAGSVAGMGCIMAKKRQEAKDLAEMEE